MKIEFVYVVFEESVLNMCYDIIEFDSVYDNEMQAIERVELMKKWGNKSYYEKIPLNKK